MRNEKSADEFERVEKAARAGDPDAQFQLAEMYQRGIGCPSNASAAYRWYLRSAEQGNAAAEFELAFCYLLGSGIEPSTKKAGHYLFRASKQGFLEAQFVLGTLLAAGKIFQRDPGQARYWLGKAAARGHEQAKSQLQDLDKLLDDRASEKQLRASRVPERNIDLTPLRIHEMERRVSFNEGVKAGRECASRGLSRYKRVLWAQRQLPSDLDVLTMLDAVYELALDTAESKGYLDFDSEEGVESLCDGSDPHCSAYKAAFIGGVKAGLKAGVYGDDGAEIVDLEAEAWNSGSPTPSPTALPD